VFWKHNFNLGRWKLETIEQKTRGDKMNEDPSMKVSFTVEITGCDVDEALCPHMRTEEGTRWCTKEKSWLKSLINVMENTRELTKTCPMVRAQFEALE
jgi:hypothetical protein